MRLKQFSSCSECITLCAPALTKVSASIIVNHPCQERVFSAGQRLPHVIREDQKVSRGATTIYQSQMGSDLPSLWHVDMRHYLSRSQLHAKDSRVNKHCNTLHGGFSGKIWAILFQITQLGMSCLISEY